MRAPPVYNICFHGTSLTSGDTRFWQVEVCRRLQIATGVYVQNVDCGEPGQTSRWGVMPANMKKLLDVVPNGCFIEFAYNDCFWNTNITLQESKDNFASMASQLKAKNPAMDIFFGTMNNAWDGNSDRATLPTFYQGTRDQAIASGVGLSDSSPAWPAGSAMTQADFPDWVHPILPKVIQVHVPVVYNAFLPKVIAFRDANNA